MSSAFLYVPPQIALHRVPSSTPSFTPSATSTASNEALEQAITNSNPELSPTLSSTSTSSAADSATSEEKRASLGRRIKDKLRKEFMLVVNAHETRTAPDYAVCLRTC